MTTSQRFMRYTAVGVIAAIVDMAALTLAIHALGLGLYEGRIVSYVVAATTAWALNRRYSFPDRRSGSAVGEWSRYLWANALGGAINYLVYAALVASFAFMAAYPFAAVAAGSLAGLAANFSLSHRFVFITDDEDAPRPPSPRGIGFLRLVATLSVASAAFLAANYAINGFLMSVDKETVRDNLRTAFQSGDLGVISSRVGDRDMGVHQANDCLIYDMASHDANGNRLYIVAAQKTRSNRVDNPGNCALLRDWLLGDTSQAFWQDWYLRYIHGYRSVAVAMLSNFGVDETRSILKASSYTALGFAIILNLAFAVTSGGGAWGALLSRHFGYALIPTAMVGFFGLPQFGQSISHAPAIVVLGLFLIVWGVLDRAGRLTERTAAYLVIAFALLTAYFEFLTGYIPVGVCVLIALAGIACFGQATTARSLIRFCVVVVGAFVATILVTFVLHTLATTLFAPAGLEAVGLFLNQLAARMGQTAPDIGSAAQEISPIDVAEALLRHLAHLGYAPPEVAAAVFLLAVTVTLVVAWDAAFMRRPSGARLATVMVALSWLPAIVWFLAFQNHTTVHASFMVRVLVVVPMAGLLAAWSWLRVWSVSRDLLSQSSNRNPATVDKAAIA